MADALRRWITNGRRDQLLAALGDLAFGHYVEETDGKGQRRVYQKSPDVRAISLIFERVDGKAPQALDIRGDPAVLLTGRLTDQERREFLEHILGTVGTDRG